MIPNALPRLVSAFFTLLIFGVLLGNAILLYLSLIPLFSVTLALTVNHPRSIIVKRREKEISSYVGDSVSVHIDVEVRDGIGLITIADTLPKFFKLIEGSNFKVLWKGFRSQTQSLSYKIECTKRGIYSIGPINWESRHPLLLKQTRIDSSEEPLKLTVRYRPFDVKRIRSVRALSIIPLPAGTLAKMGVATSEFHEIREYRPGDPYRAINWKATSRRAVQHRIYTPMVNEFEKEGEKVVWIFLDKSASMYLGSIIRNPFEYAVQAAAALARFYLERGCKVGLCIYGARGADKVVVPDTGRRQYYKIQMELTGVEVEHDESASTGSSLREAIRKCRGYLLGSKPLSIIITTITPDNYKDIVEGVKEIRKFVVLSRTVRTRQIIVMHLLSYHIAAENFFQERAATLLELRKHRCIEEVKKAGASVISWNPVRRSIAELLLTGLKPV